MNNESFNKTKIKDILIPDNKIQIIADQIKNYGWNCDSKRLAEKVIRFSNNINEKDSK